LPLATGSARPSVRVDSIAPPSLPVTKKSLAASCCPRTSYVTTIWMAGVAAFWWWPTKTYI